jgi:transketolase
MTFSGKVDMRDGFGAAIMELGENNPDVVTLTADLSETMRFQPFAKKYPDRFFQMGISEIDMMGTAAGLALGGKIPFPGTFAVFAASLANQTVRLSIAYNQANVKIVVSHGGVTVGPDGATHQAFEDIALMRLLPGMTVIVPADANEAYKATLAAAEMVGPVYLRLARAAHPVVTPADAPFCIGKADVLRDGGNVAIIAAGPMVSRALAAAETLSSEGIQAMVLNMHTIKPADESAVVAAAARCGAVVTVEEHSVLGGLGGCVAEILGQKMPMPMEFVGIQDTFGESGEPEEILEKYGLTAKDVVAAAKRAIGRK